MNVFYNSYNMFVCVSVKLCTLVGILLTFIEHLLKTIKV